MRTNTGTLIREHLQPVLEGLHERGLPSWPPSATFTVMTAPTSTTPTQYGPAGKM